jgi:hypothetical protein
MMRNTLLLLALLAGLAAAPAALADGDPASDYLLSQQTFLSPNARISASDSAELNALVTAARQRGYTIRVAVIQSSYDLGAVTSLDKKPRLYAHFLSQELRFVYKQRLLVVMPNGFGIANDGKPSLAEQAVLDRLSPAGTIDGAALVAATVSALHALTAHAGVPIAANHSPHGGTARDLVVIACAAALALLSIYLVAQWRRRDARVAADPVDDECHLVHVAPAPVLAGLERADDRVRRLVRVRRRMPVR